MKPTIQDKQKRAADTALHKRVVAALNDYESWAGHASETKVLTPVQFLAVALWAVGAVQESELAADDEILVVSAWWARLIDATAKRGGTLGGYGPYRHVVPYDALTLLELEEKRATSPDGWCIASADLDVWLQSLGNGAWCRHFFEACDLRELAGPKLGNPHVYDWKNTKTIVALLRDYENSPGKSQRAKCKHLATTEKWQGVGAETLRKQVAAARKNGEASPKIQPQTWVSTVHELKG